MWRNRARTVASAGLAWVLTAMLLWPAGCREDQKALDPNSIEAKGLGLPSTHSTSGRIKMEEECELNEAVSEPDKGTPEWVVYEALASALAEDQKKGLERYKALYASGASMARSKFNKLRSKAKALLSPEADPKEPEFTICEREEQGKDGERLRLKLMSHDEEISFPWINLEKDKQDAWHLR